jgi:hypothetical protein
MNMKKKSGTVAPKIQNCKDDLVVFYTGRRKDRKTSYKALSRLRGTGEAVEDGFKIVNGGLEKYSLRMGQERRVVNNTKPSNFSNVVLIDSGGASTRVRVMRESKLKRPRVPVDYLSEDKTREQFRKLNEAEIGFLESQVPDQAASATRAAFWDALAHGQTVVCADGDQLIELRADGSKRFIKTLKPNISLPIGTEIKIK